MLLEDSYISEFLIVQQVWNHFVHECPLIITCASAMLYCLLELLMKQALARDSRESPNYVDWETFLAVQVCDLSFLLLWSTYLLLEVIPLCYGVFST